MKREKGKKKKRKKESWNVMEFGGSGRLQKKKEVKKEKCKGTCVEEKKKRNAVRVWRIKKEGEKKMKWYHNIFAILPQ